MHGDFSVVFFSVLAVLNEHEKTASCMTLWSIWQSRNDRVWENKNMDAMSIVWTGNKLFSEWNAARVVTNLPYSSTHQPDSPHDVVKWRKPQLGWVKCKVDASFSLSANKVSVGMCLLDDRGNFLRAKTLWYTPITNVLIGEMISLLAAISWVRELGYKDVIFELGVCRRVQFS